MKKYTLIMYDGKIEHTDDLDYDSLLKANLVINNDTGTVVKNRWGNRFDENRTDESQQRKLIKPSEALFEPQWDIDVIQKIVEEHIDRWNDQLSHWDGESYKVCLISFDPNIPFQISLRSNLEYRLSTALDKAGWKYKIDYGFFHVYNPNYRSTWRKLREWWSL